MLASDLLAAAATWRPQQFGDRRAHDVPDPLVEPLWTGPRVLGLVVDGEATLTNADGEPVTGHEEVRAALVDASSGSTFLIEASLTPEPLQALMDIAAREAPTMPKPGDALTQMMVGSRGDRKDRLFQRVDEVIHG